MTLPPMPRRIEQLPRDSRGYPIPWNVLRADDGWPFFTVNDDRKNLLALLQELCPLCGERLGRWRWFVGGPRSAFDPQGWYLDLPGHHECMRFSLTACPYLALPKYLGRVDVVHPEKLPPEAKVLVDHTIDPERPEIFVAAAADKIEVSGAWLTDPEPYLPYTRPLPPLRRYEFWRHGARISTEEALPVLRGIFGAGWNPPPEEP